MFRKTLLGLLSLSVAASAFATTAPRDGGRLPDGYYERKAADRTAFTMQYGWIKKVQRVKEQREAFIKAMGPNYAAPLPTEYKVAGTITVPVLMGAFSNRAAPFTKTQLQNQLFDDPSGTVSDYYDEVSYGNIVMQGAIADWQVLGQTDTYYAGIQNGLGPDSKVGEFLKSVLQGADPTVDFSQYDNDGPDGIPNSGDDDGFVDFVSFIHSESGGECGGNNNLWSHRWVYSGWPESGGQPFTTNDVRYGGGFIRVQDYTIQPSQNCNSTIIDIGVFCHEFGHAFGLPDLYDTNGNGQGLGHWCIMAAGNWNSPASPAHPSAWIRQELGWLTPTDVTWNGSVQNIPNINENPVAFRLPFTEDRFRRSDYCAINGSYSLYCGLDQAEALARGYDHYSSGGYGNGWLECVQRDFYYDGIGAVTWSYNFTHDIEPQGLVVYDACEAIIDVGGTETVLRLYEGMDTGSENIDLSPYLTSAGPYTLMFRFYSDFGWSDEDDDHPSVCGAIVIDDISVTGGGETYSTDFETYVDGWYQDPAENPYDEYWLVANRRKIGFDQGLWNQGLLIMQIDDPVAHSVLGNSGGGDGNNVRGVVIEEANNDFDLNGSGSNRGEASDPFPGSTANTVFSTVSNPNSNNYLGQATQIEVSGISSAASTMTAFMRAGDPAPTATMVLPAAIDNDQTAAALTIDGTGFRHGATFRFEYSGSAFQSVEIADVSDISPIDVYWRDPIRLEGTANVYGKTPGTWDLVVTNPDGQEVTLPGALTINEIVATKLVSASVEVVDRSVRLSFKLIDQEDGERVRLHRATTPAGPYGLIEDDLRGDASNSYEFVDANVLPGRRYYYLLDSRMPDGEVRELYRGNVTMPTGKLALLQNFPNPFNPATSISFELPDRSNILLEIFDVSGRLVTRLAQGSYKAGPHNITWNGVDAEGRAVSAGIYVYRLRAGKQTISKKMVLLK